MSESAKENQRRGGLWGRGERGMVRPDVVVSVTWDNGEGEGIEWVIRFENVVEFIPYFFVRGEYM